jgi:hypothetical protein
MKGYRKIDTTTITFDESTGDLQNTDEEMRGIMDRMAKHTDKTGITEYIVVLYAKRRQAGEP